MILLTNETRIFFSILFSNDDFTSFVSKKTDGIPFEFKDSSDGEVVAAVIEEAKPGKDTDHEEITGKGNYRQYPHHDLKPCLFTGTINRNLKHFSAKVTFP